MKKINKLLLILLVLIIAGCSSTKNKKSVFVPVVKKVEKPKITPGDYELDYSFFKENNLPIPNNFKGNSIEYLAARNDTLSKYDYSFFKKYDERKALKFYKDLDVQGYGDNSPYWRWKISLGKKELFNAIKNNLPGVYSARPKDVLTLSNGDWESLPITASNIGNIEDVRIAARGQSGVATYLLVTTSKKQILVAKELNIRKLFVLTGKTTGSGDSVLMFGAKGGNGDYIPNPIRKDITLLPSAYFALEETGSTVTIYGGGNGHGVGMSQFAAYDLAVNHDYSYEKILKRSYPNSKLQDMYSLNGIGKTINVGITSVNGKLDHEKVILRSNGKMDIIGSGFKIDVPPKQKVVIENKGKRLWVSVNGKHRVKTYNPMNITAHGFYITVEGLKRMHTWSPQYRGEMHIKPSNTSSYGVRIINKVKIEDYLKQVVPSEMPQSFGLEALKSQAVAARTYALSDYLKGRYIKDGFHVKDTVESQVYNNQKENPDASQAVESTAGEVLLHNGKPIDAKYFSTSSGFTESASYIW